MRRATRIFASTLLMYGAIAFIFPVVAAYVAGVVSIAAAFLLFGIASEGE